MATMTIKAALEHVWGPDGVSRQEAAAVLRDGWANGCRAEGREVPALEALAGGADPADEVEVPDLAVKVHCGSAHVKGAARKFPYFVASLFESRRTADGRRIWRNAKVSTEPRRSMRLAEEDGRRLAA